MPDLNEARIYGTDLQPEDLSRLKNQLGKVYNLMIDGKWRSTYDIGRELNIPAASAHRHLSTLRTQYNFVVNKYLVGDGLWNYRLLEISFFGQKVHKKMKPIGDKELFGEMMRCIYACAAQDDLINRCAVNNSTANWSADMILRVGKNG